MILREREREQKINFPFYLHFVSCIIEENVGNSKKKKCLGARTCTHGTERNTAHSQKITAKKHEF